MSKIAKRINNKNVAIFHLKFFFQSIERNIYEDGDFVIAVITDDWF